MTSMTDIYQLIQTVVSSFYGIDYKKIVPNVRLLKNFDRIPVVIRCTEDNCQSFTNKYPWFCDQHALEKYGLIIQESPFLRQRGVELERCNGLFANEDFDEGDCICIYLGQWQETTPSGRNQYYAIQSRELFIDGTHPQSSIGRYSNDARDQTINNADFKYMGNTHLITITARRKIHKGEEIFVSYGSEYWNEL